MIKAIKQMRASLEDHATSEQYQLCDHELRVTTPLIQCLQDLKEKHNAIVKVHRERFEQVKSKKFPQLEELVLTSKPAELVQALESYSSHLEPSFVRIKLPPTSNNASLPPTFDLSPSYVSSLDNEFSRVYEEYTRRISSVKSIAEDIVNLWAELGTPQAQTESSIVKYYRDSPEQLGLHEDDMKRLQTKRDRLIEEKRGRERKLQELKSKVEGLWDRLGVEEADRKRFLASNRGCGMRAINEFEAELDRLNELKRQNLHLFVEDSRYKLQELWDGLYFSEEEMLEFAPAFSDVYSDALLSAHEAEISRLEALTEQRAPTLELINKHQSLVKDRDDLTAAAQDGSRLLAKNNKGEKRDPTRLLREEKMRKRIAKDLPKVEVELKRTLERWEDEYGRPFLVHGVRFLDELAAAAAKSLPPRSKTPSGPPPGATTKKVPLKSEPTPSSSRAGSMMRNRPQSRAGTATPAGGTLRRNPLASSVSTTSGRTPSKIPARVPLGDMQHGGNSPERRAPVPSTTEARYNTSTMRKMGPPARAPPPKMRDLFIPPEPAPAHAYSNENMRSASSASSTGTGSVRQITPEDVYDDRERMSYVTTSTMHSSEERNTPQTYRDVQRYNEARQQYVPPADSRQISTTSSVAASGSENWETFDDASEPEQDESDAYYAKLRAAGKGEKRCAPEGGHTPPRGGPGKKFKALYGANRAAHPPAVMEGEERRMVTGSESAWTDEDAF